MKTTIKVKSKDYGHVEFSNMSVRQKEILDDINNSNMLIISIAIAEHKYPNDQELGKEIRNILKRYKNK